MVDQQMNEATEHPQDQAVPAWANELYAMVAELRNQVNNQQAAPIENQTPSATSTEDAPTNTSNQTDANTIAVAIAQALAATQRPKKVLAELPEYKGERDELEAWIDQAEQKLRIDYAAYPEETRVALLFNRLRGSALTYLQPWWRTSSSAATTREFFSQLRAVFGDPHRQEKARRELRALQQKNAPFRQHFVKFRHLMLESGLSTSWDDKQKKDSLWDSISWELKDRLVGRDTDGLDFQEFANLLAKTSDDMEAVSKARNAATRKNYSWGGSSSYQAPRSPERKAEPKLPQGDRMDWEPTGPAKAASTRRAKWVSDEEVAKRYQRRLCARCGGSGHFKPKCPFLPARPPVQTNPARAPVTPTIEPELEDEDEEGNEDSGKE